MDVIEILAVASNVIVLISLVMFFIFALLVNRDLKKLKRSTRGYIYTLNKIMDRAEQEGRYKETWISIKKLLQY